MLYRIEDQTSMLIEINDDHVLTLEDMDQDQLELAECHLQSQVDHINHQLKFNKDGDEEWIESAKELFISHFYETYSAPKYPPSWMIAETLSFGTWSRVFSNLRLKDQKEISNIFNINKPEILAGWFHTLTVLRNFCAHHNRIWFQRCSDPVTSVQRVAALRINL